MTDRKKFEEMLERLVNEDREGAEELFHEIVVEKSREIYENLLEDEVDVEETTDEEVDEATDEEVDEATDEEVDEATDEEVEESKDEEVEENFFDEMDDDAEGDLGMDVEMPGEEGEDDMDMDMGGEEGEEELEDRVMDLEDELEALKAEFEAMMGDEEAPADDEMGGDDEEEMPMDMDSEEGDDDEMPMESSDEDLDEQDEEVEESKTKKSQAEIMREYTNKVTAKMGDNGANTQSTVASPNNMGGTSANIARNDTEAGVEANKGNLKGSALSDQNAKDMNTKNVNVPGATSATKLNAQPKGHGAEKKGTGETADKGAGSTISGK